jgi:RNA polymerase sigma-70 factor (ECF subfamily)
LEADERDWLRRCAAGEQAACTALVTAHARMAGTIILRTTGHAQGVEDLVQETFLRVFRSVAAFEGRSRLSTWICTIARRVAIDEMRRGDRRPQQIRRSAQNVDEDPAIEELPDTGQQGPEAAVSRDQLDSLVQRELQALPERYRLPLRYAAIDGVDYDSIAAMLDLPVGTVKTFVFRGKQMLRERIVARLGGKELIHEH